MEHSDLRNLEKALGIYAPWSISAVEANDSRFTLDVHLALVEDKKRLFSWLPASKKDAAEPLVQGRWLYVNIGHYQCVIHAQVPKMQAREALGGALMAQPGFLGHPERHYSNSLRQQVALASLKGLEQQTIAELLRIDVAVVKSIIDDIQAAPVQERSLAHLPTEADPVWSRILLDQQHLRTSSLPLKLLLSRLKLATSNRENDHLLFEWVQQLRAFFISNSSALEDEIDQICGISPGNQKRRVSEQKGRLKLVLPALSNPVWIDLIAGRLKLNSQSMPLNLLLARQRNTFTSGASKAEKIEALKTLREYFRKHHRSLRAELLLLNRAMQIKAKSSAQLPSADSDVWQKLLDEDDLLPTNHMAYKLLLSRLRSTVSETGDPAVRMQAARKIRDFMGQNHRALKRELGLIMEFHKAG